MRLAVTRPLADSERTAAALRARGHSVLVAPLLRVEAVETELVGGWGGVIITSANAAAVIAGHPSIGMLARLPLYAVGQRSADAARQAGFANVIPAGGDVSDLVRLIAMRRADATAPLLYLAGEDRAADLVAELIGRDIAVDMAVIYRAVAAPFSSELTEALAAGEIDAVLHFSRRSAEAYLAGAHDAGIVQQALAARQVCLSAQIAEPLGAAARIAIAKRPDEAALIQILEHSQA